MKKFDLGQSINTLANVGVIAGIVFLGLELHQNNVQMEDQARFIRQESRFEAIEAVYSNPNLAAVIAKARGNQPLSADEEIQLSAFNSRVLLALERNYLEWRRGRGPPNTPNGLRNRFFVGGTHFAPLVDSWRKGKDFLDPGFVDWIEMNVLAGGPP
jgi:hypothetical protein